MRLELTRAGLLVELANHYITRGAFTSPAVSRMSCSSSLDGFPRLVVDVSTDAASWDAASRTNSIQLAEFLSNSRQAYSPYA